MLEEYHEKCFVLWKEFDRVCKKNNIDYFFAYGSAIGVAREHDFIPWDDDMDVIVFRSQYKKLKQALKKDLKPNYRLIEPDDYSPYIYDFIPRIIDTSISRRKATEEDIAYHNYNDKLFIDIFIFDTAPDSKICQVLLKRRLELIYCLARSKRYNRKLLIEGKKYSSIKRIITRLLCLLGTPFSRKFLLKSFDKTLRKYEKKETNTVYTGCSPATYIGFYPKEFYDGAVLLPFHNDFAPLAKEYDKILTIEYGDYMKPVRDTTRYMKHVDDLWESK